MKTAVKTTTVETTTLTINLGEADEQKLELESEPDDFNGNVTVRELPGGGYVVGYLVHDDDCENPLDDCDGVGKILDGRNDRKAWEARREAEEPYDVLLDVYEHGGSVWRIHGGGRYFCDEQWDVSHGAGIWYPDDACKQHIEMTAGEELLAPNPWHTLRREWIRSNLLQKPELPDKTPSLLNLSAKLHSAETDEFYSNGNSINRYWYTYGYEIQAGKSRKGYKTVLTAVRGAAKAMGLAFDKQKYIAECYKEAVVCAHQAVEEFNTWLSGDCWGVCVETFDTEGEPLDQDACWGFIGSEYARRELEAGIER